LQINYYSFFDLFFVIFPFPACRPPSSYSCHLLEPGSFVIWRGTGAGQSSFINCVRYFHGRTCSVGSVGTSFGLSYFRFFCSVFVRHIDYVVYLVVNSLSSFWYL